MKTSMRSGILFLIIVMLVAVFTYRRWPAQISNSPPSPAVAEKESVAVEETPPQKEIPEPPVAVPEAPLAPPPAPPAPPAPAVSGIVVRASDETPVAEAVVCVRLPIDETGARDSLLDSLNIEPWSRSWTTEEDGEFSVEIPTPGLKYVISAEAPGFQHAAALKLVPEEGLDGLTLRLCGLCAVSGRVVDARGEPVQNVVIGAAHGFDTPPEHESLYAPCVFSEPTGPDGAFFINGLKSGYCALAPKGPGGGTMELLGATLEESPLIIELAKEEHCEGVELKLDAGSAQYIIEGIVRDSRGRPVVGATVWSGLFGGPKRTTSTRPTDEQGRFRLDCVNANAIGPDGGFAKTPTHLFCEAEGYEPANAPNVPMGSKDVVLTLVDRCRGRITGKVIEKHTRKPVDRAQVAAWQIYTGWGDRTRMNHDGEGVTTDKQGRFELPDVPAGEVTLQVVHPQFGVSLYRGGITVAHGRATEVEIALEAPGVLEVEAVFTGRPADTNNLWSALEVFPKDVLKPEDACPWNYTYAAGEYDVPVSYALEDDAAARVGTTARRLAGKDGWRKTEDGQWKGRLTLAAGEYIVKVRYHLKSMSESFLFEKVSISADTVAHVRFETGGTAAIRFAAGGSQAASSPRLFFLTPSSDAGVLPEIARGSKGNFVAPLMENSSFVAFVTVSEAGEYTFPALKPGQYTLTVYASDLETGLMRRKEREIITLAEGQEYSLDVVP